ncbi:MULTISPECIES: hypothetical protein [unclassified Bradyrhizobium]|uniref:hypothetical protein n=1 Tax=unclassified Bradyrhizobium TaxID=2631580 RepID=UPI0028EB783F|nr:MULTISPECIES: hypothetical protein [unclassified Bradyrhizobium]
MDRALLEVPSNKLRERLRLEDKRTEVWCAWQVVADAVPRRILPGASVLEFGIHSIDIGDLVRRRQIELALQQPFIEKPVATGVEPGWLLLHKLRDLVVLRSKEEPLQDGEVEAFVLECEGEMSLKRRHRRMTWRVDAPSP